MLIGIDAHNLEGKRTGVGRYVFNLLKEWSIIDPCKYFHTTKYGSIYMIKFVLYFKDEIPADLPQSELFECKLLKTKSTAKFVHWDLARAAKKDKLDILFCPGYVAPLGYHGKIALTLHDISYETRPGEFNWPSFADRFLLKWISKKAAQKASIIFTPSEFSRQEVMRFYKTSSEKIITTLLAPEARLAQGLTMDCGELEKKFGLSGKFGFFAGSIFTRRHLPDILAAFEKFAKKQNDFQFFLAGRDLAGGRVVDRIAQQINKKIGRSVILRVDFVDDFELKSLYSACAFFIWLSDYEGFGLPVLEAMSLGAPVITSDATSLKEVAGQAALLIKKNSDQEEIYQAMEKIMENESLRQELISKGREQAEKFSWKNCAEKTLEQLIKMA